MSSNNPFSPMTVPDLAPERPFAPLRSLKNTPRPGSPDPDSSMNPFDLEPHRPESPTMPSLI
jgi:hypothetical protein